MTVEPTSPQPQVVVVGNGQSGGGLATRLGGAILASCLLSGIGYVATYSTLAARLFLRHQGATVEMPAEQAEPKHKAGIVERSRGVLGDAIGKIKDQLAKTKEGTTGGIEKAKHATVSGLAKATRKGAHIGKTIEHKVDSKAEELKAMFAARQEEARMRQEEQNRQFAIEREQYDQKVQQFREHYDAQCPNQRCRAPLRTKGHSSSKYVNCARCQFRFTVGRARALGPPSPPPFRSSNRWPFGG